MSVILVVDDEQSILRVVEAILGRQGYEVLTADSAGGARIISDAHAGKVDLLITNHCLKSDSGLDVAEGIRAQQPAMRVLQISGYPEGTLVDDGTKVPGGSFLQKPFTAAQLVSSVRNLLEPG